MPDTLRHQCELENLRIENSILRLRLQEIIELYDAGQDIRPAIELARETVPSRP